MGSSSCASVSRDDKSLSVTCQAAGHSRLRPRRNRFTLLRSRRTASSFFEPRRLPF